MVTVKRGCHCKLQLWIRVTVDHNQCSWIQFQCSDSTWNTPVLKGGILVHTHTHTHTGTQCWHTQRGYQEHRETRRGRCPPFVSSCNTRWSPSYHWRHTRTLSRCVSQSVYRLSVCLSVCLSLYRLYRLLFAYHLSVYHLSVHLRSLYMYTANVFSVSFYSSWSQTTMWCVKFWSPSSPPKLR